MKMPMSYEILAMIYYLQTQRKASSILHNELLKDKEDYIEELYNNYRNLPIPEGMNTSNACFEAALYYPITEKIMNTEAEDLSKEFEFGF